jgi:hypothetical protein
VREEICALLARRLPSYEIRFLTGLGEGLDNATYEINGELIFRASSCQTERQMLRSRG